jgi:6-phosphogluconolactonase
LGSDYVAVFRFDAQSGALEPAGTAAAPLGTGPRHLTFDAAGRIVYVTFEHTSEVGVYAWDPGSGRLDLLRLLSTLGNAPGRAPNTASHIELHPSGRALYVSNRGDDSLAIFAVDGQGGIELTQRLATGKKPRHFSVNRRGDRLVVGNLDGASVMTFEAREHGLQLAPLGITEKIPQPYFVGFC